MHARAWFVNACAVSISIGIALILFGVVLRQYSSYEEITLPLDWVLSAVWISLGGAVSIHWWCWYAAHRCTRVVSYRAEALLTNTVLLFFACGLLLIGWGTMAFQSFEMPPCPCASGFYGRLCEACDCSGHGACDDGIDGSGECFCDPLYDGLNCETCISRAQGYPSCACERVWTGDRCDICAVGYDCSAWPIVTCAKGWNQTGESDGYPVCDACLPGYGGDPSKDCMPCLGGDPPCNDRGTCWDNVLYESLVWPVVKDQCTRTFDVCSSDSECSSSNCQGVCHSKFAPPEGPTQQWIETFEGSLCKEDSECNFARTDFDDAGLPEGWWQEGQCVQKVCCEEARYGNATCFDCHDANGNPTVGRLPPACDACPGWNHTVDINGQTVCNGHGTCVPDINIDGGYLSMMCACSSIWSEDDCRCARNADGLCESCAQGFYLEADPVLSAIAGRGISKPGVCEPCSGAEDGTGLAACNFMRGYGQCIYAEDVTATNLDRVGTCACTTAIDAPPQIAATGERCQDAPPGFFKVGEEIRTCPRVLRTGSCVDGARWESTSLQGDVYETCVEMCGGAFGIVATCEEGHCACNETDFLPQENLEAHYELGFNGLCRKTVVTMT